jgi:Recombinase zinc beta ribbon domain/Recombinase
VPKSRDTDDPAWSEYAAAALCENRVYLGEARAGKDIVKADAHEAIVSEGLFARVQARKGERDSFSDPDRRRPLLSGLVRCAGCGSAMVVDQRTKDGKVVQRYWRCTAGSRCSERAAVSEGLLEKHVLRFIAEHADDLNVELPRSDDSAIRAAQIRLDNANAEVAAFLANVPATTPGYGEAVAQRQAEVDDAAKALNETVSGNGSGDWSTPVDVPDEEIGLGLVVEPGPLSAAKIPLLLLSVNQFDNARARRMIRQLVSRVTVRKSAARGEALADRVTVELA